MGLSMEIFRLTIPVAFFIFNRPEHTAKVFARIRNARPQTLLVIADGPRRTHQDDVKKCYAARNIINTIDWDCDVRTNFSEKNLGCKIRVSTGLDWVFTNYPEAIILEDDCLPDISFFRYCAELLDLYRNDERVVSISGDNFQRGLRRTHYSYYFSRHPHVWGWGSWRRVWRHYDVEMKTWPAKRAQGWLKSKFENSRMAQYWSDTFDAVYQGKIDTWDHQWTYNCWQLGGVAALPEVNLISNIGFGHDATHTRRKGRFSAIDTGRLDFPLSHPPSVTRQVEADKYTELQNYPTNILARTRRMLGHWLIR